MLQYEKDLIEQVAREAGVPFDTLQALLDLDREFPNMSARGAKRRLAERVEAIITDGLRPKD